MPRDASVTLHFGDGEHCFRLRIGQLVELQEKINRPRLAMLVAAGVENPAPIGPGRIVEALGRGDLWPHEIREILRIGLIGGGAKPLAADTLLRDNLDHYALGELSLMAVQIINAAFAGEPGEAVEQTAEKKSPTAPEAEAGATAGPATGSTGVPSTATDSPSDSIRAPSIISPSSNSPP
jgi:hypothetical protein